MISRAEKKGAVSAAADAAEAEQLEKKRQKEEAAYKKKKAAEEIAKRGRHATWERLVQEVRQFQSVSADDFPIVNLWQK